MILNDWSKDAFKHEKPLFFASLTLLSERKIEQAAVMVKCGAGYLKNCENIDPRPGDEDVSAGGVAPVLHPLGSGLLAPHGESGQDASLQRAHYHVQ